MTARHAATVGWGAVCLIVRPRFIGPQLEGRAEGRHPEEDSGRVYSTALRAEVTCPACLVILDTIEELGLRVKREPIWLIHAKTKSGKPGARYGFEKRSSIRGRKWLRPPLRGERFNGRSLSHSARRPAPGLRRSRSVRRLRRADHRGHGGGGGAPGRRERWPRPARA